MPEPEKSKPSSSNSATRRKRRSPRSPAQIRELLLQAARKQFTLSGYKGTSTAAIAREADVTEALLFKYFGSKSRLCREAVLEPLKASYEQFAAQYLSDIAGIEDQQERIEIYVRSLQKWIYQQSDLLTVLAVLEAYGRESDEIEGALDWLNPYFDTGADMLVSRLDKTPKVDPALMSRISFAGVLACVMFQRWLFAAAPSSEDEIVTAIGDFIVSGIQANS